TIEKFQESPTRDAFNDARDFRVKSVKHLDSINDIRYSLAKRNPVVLGIAVYRELFTTRDGHLPSPDYKDKMYGGHAVFAVGYNDKEQHLIVKNSWGKGWGDKGYFYLPYDYVKMGLAFDA